MLIRRDEPSYTTASFAVRTIVFYLTLTGALWWIGTIIGWLK